MIKRISISLALLVALAFPSTSMAKLIELGKSEPLPPAACPDENTCQVFAKVTGFQIQVGELRNPFRVQEKGRVVALTLTLPKLTSKQVNYFNETFGGPPRVRLTVLRPSKGTKKKPLRNAFVAVGQSETIPLTDYLGSTPTFPLDAPLRVRKNDVLALTAVTWVPAFAVGLDKTNAWRASRPSNRCGQDFLYKTAPHELLNTRRFYSCIFREVRLLYTALLITDPVKTVTKKR